MGMVDLPEEPVIAVIGAGVMGRGIAQVAAVAGCTVLLLDVDIEALEAARTFIHRMVDRAVEKGNLAKNAAVRAKRRLSCYGKIEDCARLQSCDFVIEAVSEDLELKSRLLPTLEKHVHAACVLATNTSSLPVAAIGSGTRDPSRVAGMHFFNPVPLMRVVEVVETPRTAPLVIERLSRLAKRFGHEAIRVRDSPGFLVNHAGRALITEGLRVVDEGVADFSDVDEVVRDALGLKMGPFELMDLTGLDVSLAVMESIYARFYQEPRFRPAAFVRERVSAGLIGRKTGLGFYEYPRCAKKAVDGSPSTVDLNQSRTWVATSTDSTSADLRKILRDAGCAVENERRPSSEAICFVTPYGEDATRAALANGIDPRKTVAVDPMFGLNSRRSIMGTPITEADVLDTARTALSHDGIPVTVMGDSGGFIAQRIATMIVNTACDLAQRRIGRPEDIDKAVTLALGYPVGPLALGDFIGPKKVLTTLLAMLEVYREPRYRPSPWLERRARLGISLLVEAD